MRIEQTDISRLSDDNVRSLVLAVEDGAATSSGGLASFHRVLARSLRRALADRRRSFALLELDALNDDEAEGALVTPGDDPVGEALDQLRPDLS